MSLNVGQLWQTLAGQNVPEAVECFVKALFVAVPSARQATQSGALHGNLQEFGAQGAAFAGPFETAVKSQNGGFLS